MDRAHPRIWITPTTTKAECLETVEEIKVAKVMRITEHGSMTNSFSGNMLHLLSDSVDDVPVNLREGRFQMIEQSRENVRNEIAN
jgi:hypothetical protein